MALWPSIYCHLGCTSSIYTKAIMVNPVKCFFQINHCCKCVFVLIYSLFYDCSSVYVGSTILNPYFLLCSNSIWDLMLILWGCSRLGQLSKKEFKWLCQGLVVLLFSDTHGEHAQYFLLVCCCGIMFILCKWILVLFWCLYSVLQWFKDILCVNIQWLYWQNFYCITIAPHAGKQEKVMTK